MRKLIARMKISVAGKIEGPDGTADWVEAWSDDYGLLQDADACLLGGGMYPGYERYWTAIRNGLGDEFRLIVYPLIAGAGKSLFGKIEHRHGLELRKVRQLSEGRVSLVYGVG